MFFPVSGVEIPIWTPILVAFVISFFTSMAGLSGAILLLPFQFSVLGYTSPSVTPTNLVFNIVGIPSGVYRYFKEGRLNLPLAITITAGSLPGTLLGGYIRLVYLPEPSQFKLFAGAFLLYISSRMLYRMIRQKVERIRTEAKNRFSKEISKNNFSVSNSKIRMLHFSFFKTEYKFGDEIFRFNTFGLFALSLMVGVLGGIYGIGGAAMIAPFIFTFFKLPVHSVAGATLISACVTSVAGVAFYEFVGPSLASSQEIKVSPDWALGVLFGIGGIFGMYLGAATQKYVSPHLIGFMLALIVGAIGVKYVFIG